MRRSSQARVVLVLLGLVVAEVAGASPGRTAAPAPLVGSATRAPASRSHAVTRSPSRVRTAPRPTFLDTRRRATLGAVRRRGKLAVSRIGGRLRARAYVPVTRAGVDGVEVRVVEGPAGAERDPGDITAAAGSFERASELAVDETWRRDLAVSQMYDGALQKIAAATDEVGAYEEGMRGLAESLTAESGPNRDRWSRYISEAELDATQRSTAGTTIALGTAVRYKAGALHIRQVTPGSPAARAGLRRGDRMLAIDGEPFTEKWSEQLSDRGEREFRLEVERRGVRRTVVARRTEVRWPVLAQRTKEGIATIRFNDGFTTGIAQEIHDALVGLEKRGPLRGLVLDLRGNGGGLVDEAEALLDDLIERGPISTYLYGSGKRVDREASGKAAFGRLPLAVLIDKRSASMGEHVPNALKALAAERGVVVLGEPTYGKGIIQQTYRLERGSFKLSVATFNNSKLVTTQGNPVVPDISKADAIRAQRAANPGKRVVDPVMRQAIAELARMAGEREPTPGGSGE